MKLISNSFISGIFILIIVYFPLLIQANTLAALSLISLQFVPGIIYSLTQYIAMNDYKEVSSKDSFAFIVINSLLYFLIILFMGNDLLNVFQNIRFISAGGIGAVGYLFTFRMCFKVDLNFSDCLLAFLLGTFTTFLVWLIFSNYPSQFIYFTPIGIVLWQIGISTIIYLRIKKNQLVSAHL